MNGCFNRAPFRASYPVQDGWFYDESGMTRQPKIVMQPHVLSKDCRYSVDTKDAACQGCEWRKKT